MTTVKRKSKQLGQILIELGMITPEQLEQALEEHRRTPKSIGRVLIDMGMIKEGDLVRALAEQVGLEFVDLAEHPIDPTATTLLPEALARRYRAIPIGERDGKLLVAMSDPANVYALDDIRTITNRDVQPLVATAGDVERAIQKFAGMDGQVEALANVAADAIEGEEEQMEAALEDAPIVKLVNAIMTQAVGDRASDVHIEPAERNVRIRFRVDGVLHEPMPPAPKNIQGGLISRLKVMAELNIAEKRVPQDGRISMKVGGKQLDLRVATLPTVHGEKVVIRVLDKSNALLRLEDLGFLEESYKQFAEVVQEALRRDPGHRPHGVGEVDHDVLHPQHPQRGRQEHHHGRGPGRVPARRREPDAGEPEGRADVRAALRSILRADPDIVLIGEVRDKETATIAIEAALTGHLVLTSLHTNDAPSAITRLTEMDVETFLVASAIDAVVAQRLARVLCERCKEPYAPEELELQQAGYPEWLWPEITQIHRPVGCAACSNTGYRGRMGLYEVMPMTEEIERLTVERASAESIKTVAIQQGMITLRDDGLEKVRMGITSIEEVARVVK